MRFIIRSSVTAGLLAAVVLGATMASRVATTPDVRPGLEKAEWGRLPLRFEPNLGQTDPRVRFLSRGPGYTLFVTDEEMVLSLASGAEATPPGRPLRMRFAGARPSPRVMRQGELAGRTNYFVGGDTSRWRTGVPAYERIALEQIYEGIDLVFHGSQHQLEYDFVVAPDADPRQIALEVSGADGMTIDDAGNLVLRTGQLDVVQQKPIVYQEGADARVVVDGRYAIDDAGQVRFEIGAYDTARPLVIDPVVSLAFSSFLGGSGSEILLNGGIAVDRDGNAYVAGDTTSVDFPLAGAMQTNQPSLDIFVTKIAADGSRILYSTYIGGAAQEEAHDVAVTDNGELWVAGFTDSSDNPATPAVNEGFPTFNAFQPTFGGGIGDAIVLKLNAAGDALVFSSYLGGGACPGCVINRSYERAHAMTLDEAGNAYLTGFTGSPTGFATAGAFQTVMGGPSDAWVAKITAAGAKERLSYLGGSGNTDVGYGIAVDQDGFIYVTGATASVDNPATPSVNEGFPVLNAFQPAHGSPGGGLPDAFITKLTPDLSALVYSSYLGGNHAENNALLFNGRAGGVVVAGDGAAWVTGHTQSTNFPTVNPLQPRGGGADIFITKVAPDGRSLLFSTYYGGPFPDVAQDIAIDARGGVYIAGKGNTGFAVVNGLPPAPGSVNVGNNDAVVLKLSSSGTVEYATFLGGFHNDFAMSIAADDAGAAYVLGVTNSSSFPLHTPFQASCMGCTSGANDAFVAKLVLPNTPPSSTADAYSVAEDGTLNVAAPGVLDNDSDADGNPLTAVLVNGPAAGALALNADGSFDYTPPPNFNGPVTFTYRADDGRAFGAAAVVTIAVIPVNDPPTADAASLTVEQETPTTIILMGGDPDGDLLTFTITDPPDHGVLTGAPRDVTYSGTGGYAGPDHFTFKVSDGTAEASAMVSLNVTGASVASGYSMRTHARAVSSLGPNTGGEALAADFATGKLYVKSRGFPCGCPLRFTEVTPAGNLRFVATLQNMQNSPGAGIALDPFVPGGLIVANENFRQNPRISRVDIATGTETTILASPWVLNPLGNGRGAQQYTTDPANPHLLYFWDATQSKLYRLNRNTGALAELLALDQASQAGDHLTNSNDIVFDPITGTILMSDHPSQSILEIDPRSSPPAVTTLFSNLPAGPGPLALDVPARRLYTYMGAIYSAPRTGGTFSLVAANIGAFDITIGRASSGLGRSLYAMDFFRDRIYEIRRLNSAPEASGDSATTDEDVAVDVMPLANDTDANGDVLSISIVAGPANGSLELLAGGIVRYTPAANWSGTDGFSYRANDGELDSAEASVAITVNPLNDLPSAGAGGPYTVAEGGSVALAGTGSDVESASLTFDWDLDHDGTFETSGAAPTFSAATIGGPASRTVALRVTDGDGGSTIAMAMVTIENVAPAAQADSYSVNEDEVLAVAAPGVLGNDVDFDTLTAVLESGPSNGQLTLDSDGSFKYTPNAHFNGTDTFVYHANDGDADSASTTVTLTVIPVNDPPSAEAGGPYTVAEGGSVALGGTGSDVESASLTFAWDLDNDGTFETPGATPVFSAAAIGGPASRTLALRVTDADGGSTIDTAMVTIENVAPVPQPDAYSVDEDATLTVPAAGVLGNDTDFDPLTAIVVSQPSNGTLTLNANGSFTYTPHADYNGSDAFTYRASDGVAETAPVTVTLTVNPVADNAPPNATDDVATVAQVGGPWPIRVLANDTSAPDTGETLTVVGVTQPANGSVTPSADGQTVIYTSPRRFAGTDTFTYTISDGNGGTDTATVVVTVERGRGRSMQADLHVRMAATPDPVKVGRELTYRMSVENNGPSEATDVMFTHNLPAGVNVVSAVASQGSCIPGRPTSCALADLPAGATALITVVVVPNLVNNPLWSTATASANEPDRNGNNNTAKTSTKVLPLSAFLTIRMTGAPDPVVVGQPLTYTIQVGNSGPDMAPSSRITFEVDGAPTVISISVSQGSCQPPRVTRSANLTKTRTSLSCDVGTILSRQVVSATIVIASRAVGLLQASAQALTPARPPQHVFSPPTARTMTKVQLPFARLELSLSESADPVAVGEALTYTAQVRNFGPEAANVRLDHALVGTVVFNSLNASQGTCGVIARVPFRDKSIHQTSCVLGTIQPGGTAMVTWLVTPQMRETLQFQTTVLSPEGARAPNGRSILRIIATSVR